MAKTAYVTTEALQAILAENNKAILAAIQANGKPNHQTAATTPGNGKPTEPALPEIKYVHSVPRDMASGQIKGKPYIKLPNWKVNRRDGKGNWMQTTDTVYIPTESFKEIAQGILNFLIQSRFARIEAVPAETMKAAGYETTK